MSAIEIKGENGIIEISVHKYERSSAENESDANWLMCSVRLSVSPFAGHMQIPFTTNDLHGLCADLESMMSMSKSEVVFESDEGLLPLHFCAGPRGDVKIAGEMKGQHSSCKFIIYSDQTYLSALIKSLHDTNTRFPIIRM